MTLSIQSRPVTATAGRGAVARALSGIAARLHQRREDARVRRDMARISDMPKYLADDMGLPDAAFYGRFNDHRWTPRDPSGW